MKQLLFLGLVTLAVSITGCTFNLGDSSNTPAANSAPTAANKPATTANTATAPKKESDAANDPVSTSSVVRPGTVRVQFAKGDTSAYVTKDIPANGSINFLFNVKKGQTVDYTVEYDFKDSDLTVYLGEPGDQDSSIPSRAKTPKTFVVNKSGDHRLDVTNTTNKKVTITLYLEIQ